MSLSTRTFLPHESIKVVFSVKGRSLLELSTLQEQRQIPIHAKQKTVIRNAKNLFKFKTLI